jgi:hypothetical protein
MQRNQSAAKRRWADRNNAPPQCRWRLRLTAQQPPRRRKQSNGRVWEMRRRQLHKYRRRAEAWLIVPPSPKDPAGSPCDRPSGYLLRRVGPPIPSSAQTPCSRAPSAMLMRLREQCRCLNCAKLSRNKSQIVMNTPLWPLCECYMMHAAATACLLVCLSAPTIHCPLLFRTRPCPGQSIRPLCLPAYISKRVDTTLLEMRISAVFCSVHVGARAAKRC